jgi:hypothetical protein
MHLLIHKKETFGQKKFFVEFSFDRLLPFLSAVDKNFYFYFKSNFLEAAYGESLVDDCSLLLMI